MLTALLLLTFPLPQQPNSPPATLEPPAESTAWDRLKVWGDGRVRAEGTYDQIGGNDRYRGRTRFRLSGRYELLPELSAEARLSTTSGDPNNPHFDFGSGDEGTGGAEVRLDRFFLDWRPLEDFSLRAGQFGHVFADPPVFDEVIWDDDLQAAGLAVIAGPGPGDTFGYDLRGAAYTAVENGGENDPAMLGVQANGYFAAPDSWSLQLGTSMTEWFELGRENGELDNQGNTDFSSSFRVWEGFLTGRVEGGPLGRTTGFCQLMHNLDDTTGASHGYVAGVMLGRRREEGSLNLFASYYDLEANSIFSPVAQDATPIPGTGLGDGMRGIFSGIEYWVTDTLSLEFTVLTSDVLGDDDPVRLRFDIDFAIP